MKVGGSVQAFLSGTGGYVAPSAAATEGPPGGQPTFRLQKVGNQWRISKAPPYLVLTSYSFQYDYQLRNLYFFDPTDSAPSARPGVRAVAGDHRQPDGRAGVRPH